MSTLPVRLGSVLRSIRGRRGMTMRDVADKAGVSPAYVSLIENGERSPNIERLTQVSEALDVPFYIVVFLASDMDTLDGLDRELAGRLSLVAWKLIGNGADHE